MERLGRKAVDLTPERKIGGKEKKKGTANYKKNPRRTLPPILKKGRRAAALGVETPYKKPTTDQEGGSLKIEKRGNELGAAFYT